MAERKTLEQLTEYRAGRKELQFEVIGVVHKVEKLENFRGRGTVARPRRAFWLVDDSKGPEVVVASKCFLWEAHASQLGDWLEQEVGAGRSPVLAMSPLKPDYIERGQLGTSNQGDTLFKLDPPPPSGLGMVQALGDDAAAAALREWYRGEGVQAATEVACKAGNKLIRDQGNVKTTNPDKQASFASAPVVAGGAGGEAGGKDASGGKGASVGSASKKRGTAGAQAGQGGTKKAKAKQ